jgi:hypothetical protein
MTYAAEYYPATKGRPAVLDINIIAGGQRTPHSTREVSGKAEARKLARVFGATPWNF